MPLVTSIEPQKKKKQRFNIFIDGRFAFGADAEIILKFKIKTGESISQRQLDEIQKKQEFTKLFDSALRFLSYRPRSQKEIEDHLVSKISSQESIKYSQAKESDLIKKIIVNLQKYNYIDDYQFAKLWIKSRNRSNPRGKSILKLELTQKGVAREITDELLGKIKNQNTIALKSIEKKLPRWKKLKPDELKKKIYSHLSMRGFDFDTIREIVAQLAKKS